MTRNDATERAKRELCRIRAAIQSDEVVFQPRNKLFLCALINMVLRRLGKNDVAEKQQEVSLRVLKGGVAQ